MSLRKQLAIFSLLSLVLPWAGYRYVREMEAVLRDGLEQSLIERAQTVAGALERQSWTRELATDEPSGNEQAPVYVRTLVSAPLVDGSREDWTIPAIFAQDLSDVAAYSVGVFGSSLYVHVDVRDDAVVFQALPGQAPYGDRLVVSLGDDAALWRVFATAAPGRIRAQETSPPALVASGSYDDRIEAAWLATPNGYAIELRIPLGISASGIGIGIVDVDPSDAEGNFSVDLSSTWDAMALRGERIVLQSAAISTALRQYADTSNRYSVIDREGWIRAAAGRIDGGSIAPAARSFTGDLLQFLLQTDDPDYALLESPPGHIDDAVITQDMSTPVVNWYRGDLENSSRVVAGVPLHFDDRLVGALLLEQASDSVLTATNQAVLRLLSTTFIASLVALLGMLGFATWLSFRVSRLAKAASRALGPRGQIDTRLPGHGAGDEIGALARSFERLLERLNEYTSYLRTLTSKLSHELRTPLAVVSTSLDNLEAARDEDAKQYLARMRQGADRLDAILGAMSEATRMEQAIRDAAPVEFDAIDVVSSCARAYADVYRSHDIRCQAPDEPAFVRGSPELLAQLLDKLIDNAVSFSEPDKPISIKAAVSDSQLEISVANYGPALPPQMREQLFDSLVSVRDGEREKPHLGLGLYVARLIAEYHGGAIDAQNLPDDSGVRFAIVLPGISPQRFRA